MEVLSALLGFVVFFLGVMFLFSSTRLMQDNENEIGIGVGLFLYAGLCTVGAYLVLQPLGML